VPIALPLLHVTAQLSWTRFSIHWSTVIGLALLGALYLWRARVEQLRTGTTLSAGRRAAFFTALGALFFSLNGWLHDLSDSYLFSAHMVQHLLLALVVVPLMILGTPGWMLRPALRVPAIDTIARKVTRPIPAFALFNVVVVAWHLPPLYNLALAEHGVHIVQHLMFLVTAVIMWWPVLSPLEETPRISYPAQMLYLFLMTIPMSAISVSIVYAGSVLYPAYATAPRVWGISPMNDQMTGGLIMWIPGGLYFFAVISVVFFLWHREESRDEHVPRAPLNHPAY
jgi:putative membrane protein